jgi:DNA replication protein DnaC
LDTLRSHDDWKDCEYTLKDAQVQYVLHHNLDAKKTIDIQKEKRAQLLAKYKLTEQDLLPKFSCTRCNDTGYVDGQMCSCLQSELHKIIASEGNATNTSYTFQNSKETNKHNIAVQKKAQEVCASSQLKNILLTGDTGTGKTYLLSSCINYCIELNKSVFFTTAYHLNALFLECHLGTLATKQSILENLTDVDVLAIDDLGTESYYKNVTAEYLFAVINERMAHNKQTFISTNLTLSDIREKYDERIFSRLVDQKSTFIAQLEGDDKRLIK